MRIVYPDNRTEWYAKGTAQLDGGTEVYFEVPAVFREDDTCDGAATLTKVEQFLVLENRRGPLNG